MADAFIVDAVRTPSGRKGGGLSEVHPVDLGAHVLASVVDRTGIDPAAVDDVIFGCVCQVGAQAWNIGRNAWLSRRPARGGAGGDDRPPVRLVAAGGALRRPGRDGRRLRPRHRRAGSR